MSVDAPGGDDDLLLDDDGEQLLTAVREGEVSVAILAPSDAALDHVQRVIDDAHLEAEHTLRVRGNGGDGR